MVTASVAVGFSAAASTVSYSTMYANGGDWYTVSPNPYAMTVATCLCAMNAINGLLGLSTLPRPEASTWLLMTTLDCLAFTYGIAAVAVGIPASPKRRRSKTPLTLA